MSKVSTIPHTELIDIMGSLGPSAMHVVPVEEALHALEPCLFPKLDDGTPDASKGQHSVNVDVRHTLPELLDLCAGTGAQISDLVKSAWAVTLSSYVGSAEVCFPVSSVAGEGEQGGARLTREIKHAIFSVTINPDASIGELLRLARQSGEVNQRLSTSDFLLPVNKLAEPVFNTHVFFHDDASEQATGLGDSQRDGGFKVRIHVSH